MNAAEQWVLEKVREDTAPDPDGHQDAHGTVWTGRRNVVGHGDKPGQPTRDEKLGAVRALLERGELIGWHGLLAPATDEHLRAIIENERRAGITRKLLVGRANQLLAGEIPFVAGGSGGRS